MAKKTSKKPSKKKTTKKAAKKSAKKPAKKTPAKAGKIGKKPSGKPPKKTVKKAAKPATKAVQPSKKPSKKPARQAGKAAGSTAAPKSTSKTTKTPRTSKKPSLTKPAAKPPAKFRYAGARSEPSNGDAVELTVADLKKVKPGLTRKDVLYFKQLLLEKRAELLGDVESMELARDAARGGDVSHMPLHMADVGSDNFEQEFMLGLMEADRKLLVEIDEALRRIQDGYYGVCLDRGVPIGRPRLEAKPWAKYCIDAVRERERLGIW